MTKAILILALTAVACPADVFYNNTSGDQQVSAFYSTGFTQIGDFLHLSSPGLLTSLDTQFFNNGTDATFDATVTFYNAGSPVGSQIGQFTVNGISISSSTSQTVTFASLGLLSVPANVVLALSVQNVSAGGDIGVNFFDPPTVGTSDDTFFLTNSGTGLTQASTFLDIDNLYFLINGNPLVSTPEPASIALTFGMVAVLAYFKRQRMRKASHT